VLVVNRFRVEEGQPADEFVERAGLAIEALAARPGYRTGRLGRAYDDPTLWSLVTEWESVGAYRRALGAYEVKVNATPLLALSIDEPSAYEELATVGPGGTAKISASDRAPALPSGS
jgi:hypothetical protein